MGGKTSNHSEAQILPLQNSDENALPTGSLEDSQDTQEQAHGPVVTARSCINSGHFLLIFNFVVNG